MMRLIYLGKNNMKDSCKGSLMAKRTQRKQTMQAAKKKTKNNDKNTSVSSDT